MPSSAARYLARDNDERRLVHMFVQRPEYDEEARVWLSQNGDFAYLKNGFGLGLKPGEIKVVRVVEVE